MGGGYDKKFYKKRGRAGRAGSCRVVPGRAVWVRTKRNIGVGLRSSGASCLAWRGPGVRAKMNSYDGVLVSRADAQRTHSTRACLPSPLLSRVVPRMWVGRA